MSESKDIENSLSSEETPYFSIKRLREEQLRFYIVLNSLSLGIVIINLDGRIFIRNQAAGRLLEIKEKEPAVFSDIAEYFKGKADLEALAEECMKTAMPVEAKDVEFQNKFLHLFFSPVMVIKDPAAVTGLVMVIEDVTEAKFLERAKDEFFSIASHELRTPLTAIRGNLSIIRDYYSSKMADKELAAIIDDSYEASVRLIQIVKDFLDLSALEFGKMVFRKEKFDAVPAVQEVLKEFKNLAEKKKLEFIAKIPEGTLWIMADKERFKEVILNMVSNAINYTDEGRVTVEILNKDSLAKVIVADTGVGISPINQKLLFRKFTQAGEEILTRNVTKGTGLGLYISKLLAEKMGGKIGLVKSELGKGSVFYFSLPLVI